MSGGKQENKSLTPAPSSGGMSSVKTFDGTEARQSMELASTAAAEAAKAEVQAGYIMALQRPRQEESARTRIKDRCKSLIFSEAAMFEKPTGGKAIKGLSIRFAEEMLRLWGNVKVLQNVIYEDNFCRVVKVTVIDLESNTSYSGEIKIEKIVERKNSKGRIVLDERVNSYDQKVFIVRATEDEMQIKAGALVSKLIRNNGLKLIPAHIKEECIAVIETTIKKGIDEDPEAYMRKVIDGFHTLKVEVEDLEKYLGTNVKKASPSQIEELRNLYSAVKNGESTWAEIMDKKKGKKDPESGTLAGMTAGDEKEHTKPGEQLGKGKK